MRSAVWGSVCCDTNIDLCLCVRGWHLAYSLKEVKRSAPTVLNSMHVARRGHLNGQLLSPFIFTPHIRFGQSQTT